MDWSMPGFPAHHQLPEPTQTHVHHVSDAIQPSHPLSSPSPPAFNLSQHQGLFQWVFASGGQNAAVSASASVLPMNIQDWFPLGWTGCISLQSKGLSSLLNITGQKHQFFTLSFLYSPTLVSIHDYWKNHSFDYMWNFVSKVMFLLFNMLFRLVIDFLLWSKDLIFFLKEQASFNFLASVTICSDFGAQENKVSHCFSIY